MRLAHVHIFALGAPDTLDTVAAAVLPKPAGCLTLNSRYPPIPTTTKGIRAQDSQVCGRLVRVFLGDDPDDRLPRDLFDPGDP